MFSDIGTFPEMSCGIYMPAPANVWKIGLVSVQGNYKYVPRYYKAIPENIASLVPSELSLLSSMSNSVNGK